jgi:hypothetical protein
VETKMDFMKDLSSIEKRFKILGWQREFELGQNDYVVVNCLFEHEKAVVVKVPEFIFDAIERDLAAKGSKSFHFLLGMALSELLRTEKAISE